MADDFLDTNVLIYVFSTDPRSTIAEKLLSKGCAIGVQGLNEFANVARRKLGMSWREVKAALDAIRTLAASIHPLDLNTHIKAVEIAERYGLAMFDSYMLAVALEADCTIFWSEDLQDGMMIEGKLRIANPFAADPAALKP